MYPDEVNEIVHEVQKLLAMDAINDSGKRLNTHISINDDMYQGNLSHYLRCGSEAAILIKNYSKNLNYSNNLRILDFPCGYGRVTRWLRFIFPESEIVGSDTTLDAVDFSKINFLMEPFEAKTNFNDNKLEGHFNLIWVGSLITHIPQEDGVELLNFLTSHLDKNSQLFLSFLGEEMQNRFISEDSPYGLSKESANEVLVSFREKGYGYSNYPNQKGYGISLISSKWWSDFIYNRPEFKLEIVPLGWDKHHNIAVITRV